jgi:hypothetical protein
MKNKSKEFEEYVNEKFEVSVAKDKGQDHCHIQIVGEEDNILTGVCCLIDTLIKKLDIDRDKVLAAIEVALGEEKEEKKKITVKEIHIDGEEKAELEQVLKKIIKEEN